MHPHWLSPVKKKSVAPVARAVMHAQEIAQALIAQAAPLRRAALVAPTQHPWMAATNLLKPQVRLNPPLSAYAKSPRQLQQLTVPKESKHAATRSQKVP